MDFTNGGVFLFQELQASLKRICDLKLTIQGVVRAIALEACVQLLDGSDELLGLFGQRVFLAKKQLDGDQQGCHGATYFVTKRS